MKDFSLILPIRKRSPLVRRLFDSIIETTSNLDFIEIFLCVDEDDVESQAISHEVFATKILADNWQGMGDIYRACYEIISSRYLMLINDDLIFRTKNWDIKVLEALSSFPDDISIIYADDLYYGDRLCSFPIISRTTCDLMGGICPRDYKSHCIDSHLYDIFERLANLGYERRKYLPDVVFEHMHYGVTLSSYEDKIIEADHTKDQSLYLSLAEQRQQFAREMMQHIESWCNITIAPPLPSASIIIWTKTGLSQSVTDCLEAIYEDNKFRRIDYELVIISDSPVDPEKMASLFVGIRDKITFFNSTDDDTPDVLNKAVTISQKDCLVFLDDRCLPRAGWLRALLETAMDEHVGIVGSKWVNPRNGRIEHIGIGFYQDQDLIKGTHIHKGVLTNHPAIEKTRDFQAVEMAGMLVKRTCAPERIFGDKSLIGWENLLVCLEAKKAGQRIVYSPKASLFRYCDDIACDKVDPADLKNIPIILQEKLKYDLKEQLDEDGLSLDRTSIGYVVRKAT